MVVEFGKDNRALNPIVKAVCVTVASNPREVAFFEMESRLPETCFLYSWW